MKFPRWLPFLSSFIFLYSCGSIHYKPVNLKNYGLGQTKQENIGSPMVKHKKGVLITGKKWVGMMNSPDGWEHIHQYSDDSFQEELIYTGREGDIIHISYREFKKDFARPAFYQELIYDLSKSDKIVFKQFKIKVVEATNEYIKFIVLTD
jgi:hypothetical protein